MSLCFDELEIHPLLEPKSINREMFVAVFVAGDLAFPHQETEKTSGLFQSFRDYPAANVGVFPVEGSGGFGVQTDVLHELAGKISH